MSRLPTYGGNSDAPECLYGGFSGESAIFGHVEEAGVKLRT